MTVRIQGSSPQPLGRVSPSLKVSTQSPKAALPLLQQPPSLPLVAPAKKNPGLATPRQSGVRLRGEGTQAGWPLGVPQFFSHSSLYTLRYALQRKPMTLLIEGYPLDDALRQELRRGFSTQPHHRGVVVRTTPGSATRLTDVLRRHLGSMGNHYGTLYPRGYTPTEVLEHGRNHELEIDPRELAVAPDEGYFTNAEALAWMRELEARYPTQARVFELTSLPGAALTHEGRPIPALRISQGVDEFSVKAPSSKPGIVLASQHHARELNSSVMSLYAMKNILEGAQVAGSDMAQLLEDYEIFVVPTVNPDGLEKVWDSNNMHRKNGRVNEDGSIGVDNNRNYGFLFGECGASATPSTQTYKGPSAYSEPETQTMAALGAWLSPTMYLDFHSYGQEVLTLYAPCSDVAPSVAAMGEHYADALRTPMGYAVRAPTASGEAPHDFWAKGAMAFLIEVGTSFQPAFDSTVAEERRVWAGVKEALNTWKPARWGRVTSTEGDPLVATLEVEGIYNHDEKSVSRSSDGRYGLWLPLGKHQVRVSAEGHQSKTIELEVKDYNEGVDLDVELAPASGPQS